MNDSMCSAALDIYTRETAPAPAPRQFVDILPERGGKRGALVWMPDPAEFGHLAGWVRLEFADDAATYSVSECPASRGRVFFLTRLQPRPGRKRNPGYAVQCVDGAALYCDCEARTPYCRHRDCVDTLLANGWL